MSEDLKRFYSERSSWRNYREENIRLSKAVKLAEVRSGVRILDVGCRDGHLKKFLKGDYQYSGIDIVPEFEAPDITIQDICAGTNFEAGFFDVAFCIEVLEHVTNPYFVLREIHRILKPGGRLVLSVPNPYHFKEILWNLLRVKDRQGHLFSWTRQTMERFSQVVGFSLEKTIGTYLHPPVRVNGLLARSIIYRLRKTQESSLE
ncbi:MAG: class I SAM-dependent methyltransferase [Candidatus Zixiibacteriota bacterium]|nr:MAG: class I SAM-dependent methyltransferase [candidate division Zixibacteria bacterium]